MYVSPMTTRLSRGKSTPAILAIVRHPLALLLLVFRVLANHHHPAVAADDLALLAHALTRRTHLHRRNPPQTPYRLNACGTCSGPWTDRKATAPPSPGRRAKCEGSA